MSHISSTIKQLAANIADNVHHFGNVRLLAALVAKSEFRVEPLGISASALGAAGVRRDDRQIRQRMLLKITDKDRRGIKVVHRNIKEALNLRGVQIDRQQAIGAGHRNQIRDQLRRDRNARAVLLIGPAIAVIRNTAVIRSADERRNASSMTNNSIRYASVGGQVGCTIKTSPPRTFSSI